MPLVEVERVVVVPDEFLERMSERVRRMHTENGLLEAVRNERPARCARPSARC